MPPLPDDDLRQNLTVVAGYLGLLLDDPGSMGAEQRLWLERAAVAAGRAVALCEVGPPAQAAVGVTQR